MRPFIALFFPSFCNFILFCYKYTYSHFLFKSLIFFP
jgi:hypothetical protein